ncbi:MAG: hypothetical protein EOP43_05285 [Sphingobacteriaceae bacterium]|nr:MAG: hypothetical protein EOP43_05285 [Sphingobacteriaceae bacterium]
MKILLLSLYFLAATYGSTDRFANTNWVSKAANRYTDSFNFRENKYVVHYCALSERTFHGCYTISKDTLIIKERNNIYGDRTEYYRTKFLLKNQVLYPYSHEEMIAHRWEKSKIQLAKSYTFRKI